MKTFIFLMLIGFSVNAQKWDFAKPEDKIVKFETIENDSVLKTVLLEKELAQVYAIRKRVKCVRDIYGNNEGRIYYKTIGYSKDGKNIPLEDVLFSDFQGGSDSIILDGSILSNEYFYLNSSSGYVT